MMASHNFSGKKQKNIHIWNRSCNWSYHLMNFKTVQAFSKTYCIFYRPIEQDKQESEQITSVPFSSLSWRHSLLQLPPGRQCYFQSNILAGRGNSAAFTQPSYHKNPYFLDRRATAGMLLNGYYGHSNYTYSNWRNNHRMDP